MNIKSGTLQFWGEWFGRPHDNFHTVTKTYWEKDNILIIKFDEGETATIYNPKNIISNKRIFYIEKASLITFEWFYYGREHITENLYRLEYQSIGDNEVLCKGTGITSKNIHKNGEFAMRIV